MTGLRKQSAIEPDSHGTHGGIAEALPDLKVNSFVYCYGAGNRNGRTT
jgi:hypothetical protein